MEADVQAFLEHSGVKGMKWGIRKGPDGVRPAAKALDESWFGRLSKKNTERYVNKKMRKASGEKKRFEDLTPEEKKQHASDVKKMGLGIAAVVIGAAATKLILSQHKSMKIKDVKTLKIGEETSKKILAQRKSYSEIVQKQKRLVSAANQHLRSVDNALDIPIRDRVRL